MYYDRINNKINSESFIIRVYLFYYNFIYSSIILYLFVIMILLYLLYYILFYYTCNFYVHTIVTEAQSHLCSSLSAYIYLIHVYT